MEYKDFKKKNLPDSPGVYFFKMGQKILYIGKATSLRDRVRSYFMSDLINTRGPAILDMVSQSNKITFEKTDSVLEALVLETLLIKKYQPKYNIKEKDDKSYNFVIVTKEEFPKILIKRERELASRNDFQIKKKYGPFTSKEQLQIALKIVRRIFPFYDEKKPSKLNAQIGIIPNTDLITKEEYQKSVRNIELFFEGKKNKVIKLLNVDMKNKIKLQEFEKANLIKKQLFAIDHLNDVTLIMKKDQFQNNKQLIPNLKIESYDISHTAGQDNVGALVVMIGGELIKKSYRKFIIKKSKGGDDIASIKEIISRRLKHKEWQLPNLFVVDGGKSQKKAVEDVLKSCNIKIPVVSVLKDKKHNPFKILGLNRIVEIHGDNIIKINNETHRFVIDYHRKKRQKKFL